MPQLVFWLPAHIRSVASDEMEIKKCADQPKAIWKIFKESAPTVWCPCRLLNQSHLWRWNNLTASFVNLHFNENSKVKCVASFQRNSTFQNQIHHNGEELYIFIILARLVEGITSDTWPSTHSYSSSRRIDSAIGESHTSQEADVGRIRIKTSTERARLSTAYQTTYI